MKIEEYIRTTSDIFNCVSCGADAVEFENEIYVISTPRVDAGESCPICGSFFQMVYTYIKPRKVEKR